MSIENMLEGQRIVPVLAFDSVDEAVDVCGVLVDNGISLLEVTLRTPVALACIQQLSAEFPQATVGAGTILDAVRLREAVSAGAVFGVSPGLVPSLAAEVRASGFPFLPGVATISEAMLAREYGFRTLKLFPAEHSGGVGFIQAAGSVLPDVRFCPTGGLGPANAGDYLRLANVAAVGGTWMIKRDGQGRVQLQETATAVRACFELTG